MSFQNKKFTHKKFTHKKFTLTQAEEKDREDIRKIIESGSFEGDIAVQYLRGDDPLASFEKEGQAVVLIVREKESGRAVGMGGCIIRPAYVNGELKRAGYLIGLKFIPEYQHKTLYLPDFYKYLHEVTKEHVDFYYSSILEENISVRNMLEKKRKSMPEYRFLDSYTVYFCKTGNFQKTPFTVKQCERSQVEEFYAQNATKYNLIYPTLSENDLRNADFYGIYKDMYEDKDEGKNKGDLRGDDKRDKGEVRCEDKNETEYSAESNAEGKKLLGMGYIINQQKYKKYIIKNYSGIYKYLSMLPIRILGYPSFPKKNQPAHYTSMGLMVKDNNEDLAYELAQQMLKLSPKQDFIMMGLLKSDPLNTIFLRIKNVKYKSRIYHVTWDAEDKMTEELMNNCMKLECAFM